MNKYILTECVCPTLVYGVIETNLTQNEIQYEINKIKKEMTDEEKANYSIKNVIKSLKKNRIEIKYEEIAGRVEI